MDYLKCPECGEPLSFEVGLFIHHNISADGEHFIDCSAFGWSCRVAERLLCKHCGKEFVEGENWQRDEKLNIVLI